MFDKNSLDKLTESIPEDMKDKLKSSAMEKLGLSKSEVAKNSEEAAAHSGETVDQAPIETNATSHGTSDEQAEDAAQSESMDEDKEDAA